MFEWSQDYPHVQQYYNYIEFTLIIWDNMMMSSNKKATIAIIASVIFVVSRHFYNTFFKKVLYKESW